MDQQLKIVITIIIVMMSGCVTTEGIQKPSGLGAIVGCVVDGVCGSDCVLLDANIQVEETKLGSMTKANGKFKCIEIPVGNYNVFAVKSGYHKTRILNVRVATDSATIIHFALVPIAIPENPVDRTWIDTEKMIQPISKMFSNDNLVNLHCDK